MKDTFDLWFVGKPKIHRNRYLAQVEIYKGIDLLYTVTSSKTYENIDRAWFAARDFIHSEIKTIRADKVNARKLLMQWLENAPEILSRFDEKV
jgi:hypothetical protein